MNAGCLLYKHLYIIIIIIIIIIAIIARHRRRAFLVPPARNCGWDCIGRSEESKLWHHRRIPLLRPVWRDFRISFVCCYCNLSGDVYSFCLLRARCLMGLNGIMWLVKTGLSPKVSYVRFFDHPIRFRFDRALSQKRIMACITQQRDQDLQVVWQPEK